MKNVFEKCLWISADKEYSSPIILRRFNLDDFKKVTLFITGLGYFDAKINGVPVTKQYFLPVASDYEPRDFRKFLYPLSDTTTNRIYYYEFDITSLLNMGDNLLEIQLGNGFYRQTERTAEGDTSFSDVLKAIYRIDIESDSEIKHIFSDGSETQKESAIRYNNIFHGETVDLNFICSNEKKVDILPDTSAILSKSIGTPDKIIDERKPQLIAEKNNKKIYDVGENISGIVALKTSAPKGSVVTLRFAENINSDCELDFYSTGADFTSNSGKRQIQEDIFITDGKPDRCFSPRFVWHTFRYFEVCGDFDELNVYVVHSDTPVTSSFKSSLEGAEFLYNAFLRTQLNNMHGSFPSDCPHRERLGYTGDGQLCAPAAMLMLDCKEFYKKWIQDILDCQDKQSGHIQHTAPFMGGGGGPGGWGSAIITVPFAYYKQYGDIEILKKCYDSCYLWINYLKNHRENGLVTHEEKDGWCLGDWCTREKTVIPESYVNSCYFVKNLSIMEEIAEILGKPQDANYFSVLRKEAQRAIIESFFDPETYHFAEGIQGADAYAVWCGIGNEKTLDNVIKKYENMGYFDTGFLGTDILLEVLFRFGRGDIALSLLQSEEKGSFLYMKRRGATTIWETWGGGCSHCHPMFGGCSRHLFTGILGIKQREGTAGYGDVIINPVVLPEGESVGASITTPKGKLTVEIDSFKDKMTATVTAPSDMKISFDEQIKYNTILVNT